MYHRSLLFQLLQVNHQWDEQYRLQKADKERLAAELRKRTGQSRENSQVQRQSADVPSDKETTKLVQELTKRNDELHEQVVKLTKEQKKRDELWTAAKKMINQEKAAKETITQMKLVILQACLHDMICRMRLLPWCMY